MSAKARRILLTGITGGIGVEVAAELAAAGHTVIGLVHRNPKLLRNDGRPLPASEGLELARPGAVTTIRGDVTEPGLALDADTRRRLLRSVDMVVHSAAIVDFGRAPEVYRRINTSGTAHVLELTAEAPGSPLPLLHVSTAYVCGERHVEIGEDELAAGQHFANPYEHSKYHAELLVRDRIAAGGLAAIVRPSIVTGASRTGIIRDFKTIYAVLKVLCDGRVRSIPARYGGLLDLVPVDYVTRSIVEVAERLDEAAGTTFHLVGAAPMSLRDLSDVLAEYPTFYVPRFVPPDSFARDAMPPSERLYYDRIVSLYESYFSRGAMFRPDHATEFLGRRPTSRGKSYLRRLFDYCTRVGFLGRPRPGVDEVLAGLHAERAREPSEVGG